MENNTSDKKTENQENINSAAQETPALFYIFKCSFNSFKLQTHGLIFFALNVDTADLGFKNILATLKPKFLEDIDLNLDWDVIKEQIYEISITQSVDMHQGTTEDLNNIFSESFEDINIRSQLTRAAEENDMEAMKESIKDIITDVMPGRIDLTLILEKGEIKAAETEKEISEEEKIAQEKESRKFIKIKPVVDPLFGQIPTEYKKGTKIFCNIADKNYDEKFLKSLGSYFYGEHVGKVESYEYNEKEPDKSKFIVNLHKEYYGICDLHNKVKVKPFLVPDVPIYERSHPIYSNAFAVYTGIIILFIIFLFFIYIYYAWLLV